MSQGAAASARQSTKIQVHRVDVDGDDGGIEMRSASDKLALAAELRKKYKGIDKGQNEPTNEKLPNIPKITVDYGVYHFAGQVTQAIPFEEYYDDVMALLSMNENGHCRAACKYRLSILEEKYNLYRILNSDIEESADRKRRGGGVHANSTKVDTSVRLSTCMSATELLETIQKTLSDPRAMEEPIFESEDLTKSEQNITLQHLFNATEMEDVDALTVEGLGLHPPAETQSHPFDAFDPTRNRAGKPAAQLLRAFLTRDTLNGGRFFANSVTPPLHRREQRTKYIQASELSIELYGRYQEEWYRLADWVALNDLNQYNRNMWIIELPRIKSTRGSYGFEFHQAHLDNMFRPLFDATLNPDDGRNINLAALLQKISGFCIRSDEDTREMDFIEKPLKPGELSWKENPSDLYFAYFVWANLCSLNSCRIRAKLDHRNTFQLRAVAGERSTQLDSLVYSFLLCDNISQGLLLEDQPVLQFLYGSNQIGISMSPLSNNGLNVQYANNPFPIFFRRSLNVSLATHNPLHYHDSSDPLLEEFATAAKLYKLSAVDMTELARNSVVQSGFRQRVKNEWLGVAKKQDPNAPQESTVTSVPSCRLEFREAVWACEHQVIEAARKRRVSRGSKTAASLQPMPPLSSPERSSETPMEGAELRSPAKKKSGSLIAIDDNVKYTRVCVDGPVERDTTHTQCAASLLRALKLRREYHPVDPDIAHQVQKSFQHSKTDSAFEKPLTYSTVKGVICLHETTNFPRVPESIRTYEEFRVHMAELTEVVNQGSLKSFTFRRLLLLEHKYRLHVAVNHSLEAGSTEEKASQNRDFYQATKVDTNVRSETGMTARQLLNFIIAKANNNGDDIVSQRSGEAPQTLRQLLEELTINPARLTVDDLNVQVDATTEMSATQFTPEAKDELLALLLKTDNEMKGRYFAELTKLTFEQFKRDNFTYAEYRLPIYGASYDEWELLSSWFDTHGMASNSNHWMIQIPRIYSYLHRKGTVKNFAEYLNNIFKPLWEVSLHPTKKRGGPRLFHFLNHVSGFDCVEDESKADMPLHMATTAPQDWTSDAEPPYNYYLYHIWANIGTLNEFRRSRNYSTFTFRPSCGERGSTDHLLGGFLLADGISYGLNLRLDSVMQYLFYLAQLGISVSPLSNNTNLLDYLDNPFPKYFRRGLNVSLSTDGPLRYHHTQEPLIEEYSIASKVWKLSPNDMCEIARNSVHQSGFPREFKINASGPYYFLSSSRGNDATRTHLSDIRVAYRWEAYHTEMQLLEYQSGQEFPRAMYTLKEEEAILKEHERNLKHSGGKKEGIIVATHDEVDVFKLSQNASTVKKQLSEVEDKVKGLQKANKQLSETLAEVMAKDMAARHERQGQVDETDSGHGSLTLGEDDEVLRMESDGDDSDSGSGSGSSYISSAQGSPPPDVISAPQATPAEPSGKAGVTFAEGSVLDTLPRGHHGQTARKSYVAFGEGSMKDSRIGTSDSAQPPGPPPEASKSKRVSDTRALVSTTESMWTARGSVDGSNGSESVNSIGSPGMPSHAQRLLSDANEELEKLVSSLNPSASNAQVLAPRTRSLARGGPGLTRMLATEPSTGTVPVDPSAVPKAPPRARTSANSTKLFSPPSS